MTQTPGGNLLGAVAPTLLPDQPDAEVARQLAEGADAERLAADHPSSSLAWAELADAAFEEGRPVVSYAFARTGYHRGLDGLRRAGWKGHGPVPWSHVPNQGFLRSVHALGRAAAAIGETDEAQRCAQLLQDSDPEAAARIGA